MFLPLRNFGSLGVIHDTTNQALPVGSWSDALNMRFTGVEMQKMLEPTLFAAHEISGGEAIWMQTWADGRTSYVAVVVRIDTADYIYRFRRYAADDPGTWDQVGGPYASDGQWQSFEWGNTCVFNNGVDVPQIWDGGEFVDLPNWGLISNAQDLLQSPPGKSRDVNPRCVMLVPYKSFLVALGITENGKFEPNKIWWSDVVTTATIDGAPDWNYENPGSLSGQVNVGLGDGAIRTGVVLNEQLIIYTDAAAIALQVVGGAFVMDVRRLFNKGAASLHSVAEFNNQHFCVSRDQIYIHDGNVVNLIAKDRVEEEFFIRTGKGGRYGTGDVDWDALQVVKNPDRKEVMVCFNSIAGYGSALE